MAPRSEPTPNREDRSKIAAVEEIRSDTPKQKQSDAIPIWEWIVGAIGFLLVASVIGLLLYQALEGDQTPPDVRLSVDSLVQTANGYLVKITAINQGGSTAEGVIVEGVLRSGAGPLEQSQTTIEYLPPRSQKRAGLFFSRDPRQFELQVRPLGYEEP